MPIRNFVKAKRKCATLLCALHAALSFGFASEHVVDEEDHAFEGQIHATLARDSQPEVLLYTISSHFLRVESTVTNGTSPTDLLNRASGELTLIFPHNRSFIRMKAATARSKPAEMPASAMPGAALIPMPPPAFEKLELRDTNEKTNILGFACEHFEMHQGGKRLDLWATDRCGAFQPYLRSQPVGAPASTIEEQWSELLKAKRLFPLLAVLKLENGMEQMRFAVTGVVPQNFAVESATLFQPPADYHEVLPLPF